MEHVITYFKDKNVDAVGIGTFGPIDIDPGSPSFGYVTTTPKPGWANYNFLGTLKQSLPVPCGWDTDVNAAAFGEAKWGAAKGLDSCVYYTVGTGVGVGVYSEGKLVHGLVHPEGGHVWTRRHPGDSFAGFCSFHGDCLEGLASGPALEARWKVKGSELPAGHPAWEIEAFYITGRDRGDSADFAEKNHFRRGRHAAIAAFPYDPRRSPPESEWLRKCERDPDKY